MPKITKDIPPIKSPADPADNRRQTPKRQNSLNLKQPVFLCEIIQPCCIPLRNLRNLRENNHVRVLKQSTQTKPQCLPLIIADKPPNPKTTKQPKPQTICLSLRNNTACCIRLRDLRYLRENNTQEYSSNSHKEKQ